MVPPFCRSHIRHPTGPLAWSSNRGKNPLFLSLSLVSWVAVSLISGKVASPGHGLLRRSVKVYCRRFLQSASSFVLPASQDGVFFLPLAVCYFRHGGRHDELTAAPSRVVSHWFAWFRRMTSSTMRSTSCSSQPCRQVPPHFLGSDVISYDVTSARPLAARRDVCVRVRAAQCPARGPRVRGPARQSCRARLPRSGVLSRAGGGVLVLKVVTFCKEGHGPMIVGWRVLPVARDIPGGPCSWSRVYRPLGNASTRRLSIHGRAWMRSSALAA